MLDPGTTLLSQQPCSRTFLGDVLEGLQGDPKTLPCKYFYDKRGSRLFDRICELDEYYLTRVELNIMRQSTSGMAACIGENAMLVEYGSGSSLKTRLLLDHLSCLSAYVPVDISRKHLHQTAENLASAYPNLEILPVCADFTGRFPLPQPTRTPARRAVYFPGSTIGNFQPAAGQRLLQQINQLCGPGGGMLIGIDLQKDVETLEAAYNDRQGITAEFNLNLLQRINRELDGDFRLDRFRHIAAYNPSAGRIEIFLESLADQSVAVGDQRFHLAAGERICTEHSHKYTIEQFARLAATAGFRLRRSWTDEQKYFAVLHFSISE